jgi:hypothetical protein
MSKQTGDAASGQGGGCRVVEVHMSKREQSGEVGPTGVPLPPADPGPPIPGVTFNCDGRAAAGQGLTLVHFSA